VSESSIVSARRNINSGPVAGRVILLFGAYAPIGLIVGARVIPAYPGYIAVAIGLAGLAAWVLFLRWLRTTQPHPACAENVELIDAEVTGYIVSILLPLVAAGQPTTGDLIAYGFCAVLILCVAYTSNLAAVNPLIYFLGFRVGRATVDGQRTIVLLSDPQQSDGTVTVVNKVGVTLIRGNALTTETG
jgi:hypothetical protein